MCCCNTKSSEIKDPVCGMTVQPERAAGSSTYRGTTFHFCSKGCKTKFDADPEHFAPSPGGCCAPTPEAPQAAEIDPVCGMKVIPEKAAGHSDQQGRRFFFCSLGYLMPNPDGIWNRRDRARLQDRMGAVHRWSTSAPWTRKSIRWDPAPVQSVGWRLSQRP